MTDAPYAPMTGPQLKAFREETLKITQDELADLIGCSKRALGQYELGRSPIPKWVGWGCAGIAYGIKPMGRVG